MAVPQTQKKVGPAGCIISIVIFVLGAIAAVVLFFLGVFSIVNKLQDLPHVDVGSSQQVQVSQGRHDLYFADLNNGSSLPSRDPTVTITDPSGDPVFVGSATDTTSQTTSSGAFRTLGSFSAPTTGSYDIKVDAVSGGTGATVIIGPPLSDLVGGAVVYIVLSIAVGVITFIIAVILGIVWLVRRSRAKRTAYPTYQGGPYGGPPGPYGGPPGPYGGPPPPGPPGGYGGPPPPSAPGGGVGPPPSNPPAAPAPGPPPGPPPGTPGSF
jgi:hypothetical protein